MIHRHPAVFSALLLGLAGIAGYVDAAGYIAFDGVFVANMTGNSVILGIAAVAGSEAKALHAVLALAGFLVGAAFGVAMTERSTEPSIWPRSVTLATGFEAVLLAGIAALRTAPHTAPPLFDYVLVTFLAISMGLQSAAARKLAVPAVSTVVLTSTLVALVARVYHAMQKRAAPGARVREPRKGPGILFGVWLAYVGCGALGAAAARWAPQLLFVPAAAAAALIAAFAGLASRPAELEAPVSQVAAGKASSD